MVQVRDPTNTDAPPRDLTKEEKAELHTGEAIRNLVRTDGWKVYAKILEMHLQGKRNEWEQPAEIKYDGIAQAMRGESAKGAIMALRLALSIPESVLDNDKVLRAKLGLAASGDPDD